MTNKPGHLGITIPNHGQYETNLEGFDAMLAEYGHWSLKHFRRQLNKLAQEQGMDIDYSDIKHVTHCLFIMAELSGLATN